MVIKYFGMFKGNCNVLVDIFGVLQINIYILMISMNLEVDLQIFLNICIYVYKKLVFVIVKNEDEFVRGILLGIFLLLKF